MSAQENRTRLGLLVALSLLVGGLVGPAFPAAAVVGPCGFRGSASDLNGDGYDDAVVGNPYATVDGKKEAGTVTILWGDDDHLIGEGTTTTVLTQADLPGTAVETGDHFGWAVSLADANQDNCVDLLIGTPDEDVAGQRDAGLAQFVTFAPPDDSTPAVPRGYTLTQADLGGQVEAGDRFGTSVALAATGLDGNGDLSYVGAPGEDVGSAADAGAVDFFNTTTGARGPGERVGELRQGIRGLPGTPATGDRFGAALAVGAVSRLGQSWLLIGTPGDTVDGKAGAGTVTALPANSADRTDAARQLLSQASRGVPGNPEAGDAFGTSVAGGQEAFMVGSPGEDVGSVRNAGTVNFFGGAVEESAPTGLTPGASLTQNTPRLGVAEAGDAFGATVAVMALNYTFAIGVPGEDLGRFVDAGAVAFANGTPTELNELRSRTLESSGAPRVASASGSRFGAALGSQRGDRENVLTASAPRAGHGLVVVFSSKAVGTRAWVAGRHHLPTDTGRFGFAVSAPGNP